MFCLGNWCLKRSASWWVLLCGALSMKDLSLPLTCGSMQAFLPQSPEDILSKLLLSCDCKTSSGATAQSTLSCSYLWPKASTGLLRASGLQRKHCWSLESALPYTVGEKQPDPTIFLRERSVHSTQLSPKTPFSS